MILPHGMNQDTDEMECLTRFDELADKDGIIAVYPSALHGRWKVARKRLPSTFSASSQNRRLKRSLGTWCVHYWNPRS